MCRPSLFILFQIIDIVEQILAVIRIEFLDII